MAFLSGWFPNRPALKLVELRSPRHAYFIQWGFLTTSYGIRCDRLLSITFQLSKMPILEQAQTYRLQKSVA